MSFISSWFVMPHRSGDEPHEIKHLSEAIESIFSQTDEDWHLVIIDDASFNSKVNSTLVEMQQRRPDHIHLLKNSQHRGPGYSRNQGIRYAVDCGADLILFLDSDDIAYPYRLFETKNIFNTHPDVSVVYSSFDLVDKSGKEISKELATPSIKEILDFHELSPVQGLNAWIDIGTRTGYANLTSTTAVSAALAFMEPFPELSVSEDAHTWLRYSARGSNFVFFERNFSKYRIDTGKSGSSSRARAGGNLAFLRKKARTDYDGFSKTVDIAIECGKINAYEAPKLRTRFLTKMADTLKKEAAYELSDQLYTLAQEQPPTEFLDQLD